MIVVTDRAPLPAGLARPVVALGNFDGVHRGHAAVLARARDLAQRFGRPAAVLTFEPHPADYFTGRQTIFRLTPFREKVIALSHAGMDGVIVLPFDSALADQTAESFVEDTLVARLQISGAVIGDDFHFGRGRGGTPAFLQAAGARWGFAVEVVERILADHLGSLEAVSSTATREALARGDVGTARQLLGHPWFVTGEVIHGRKLGRTLGFPTANLALDASTRLAFGIYAVRATVDGTRYRAVASFGRRPTFDNGPPLLEVFIPGFSGDLYGKVMDVTFVAWLRGEEKFEDVDALKAQMQRDTEAALAALAKDAAANAGSA